jgi:hypothetical protein
MKSQQNSLNPEEWKKIARKDLQRAERNLGYEDAEAAGFLVTASIGKIFKSVFTSTWMKA